MAKLEHWQDLFKYNKELLEDEYNKDQSLTVKLKSKSADGNIVSAFLPLECHSNSHSVQESLIAHMALGTQQHLQAL